MGWALGYDTQWKRDIGYGVPAWCDHPGCTEEIDRGLGYVCGGEPYGGDLGCGLYFCAKHLFMRETRDDRAVQSCARCCAYKPPYRRPKPDHPDWIAHKLTNESWSDWRAENPEEVAALRESAK